MGLIGDGKMGLYDLYDRIMHDTPARRAQRSATADRIGIIAGIFVIVIVIPIILVLVLSLFDFWTTRLFPSDPKDKTNAEADRLLCHIAEASKVMIKRGLIARQQEVLELA